MTYDKTDKTGLNICCRAALLEVTSYNLQCKNKSKLNEKCHVRIIARFYSLEFRNRGAVGSIIFRTIIVWVTMIIAKNTSKV